MVLNEAQFSPVVKPRIPNRPVTQLPGEEIKGKISCPY